MPKKFRINTKASEARERKALAEDAKNKDRVLADEKRSEQEWKQGARDTSKKDKEEEKRLEKLRLKQERELLQSQEAASITAPPSRPLPKDKSRPLIHVPPKAKSEAGTDLLARLPPSPAKSSSSQRSSGTEQYAASTIDDALVLLESSTRSAESVTLERHPERRLRAAYAAFEARELPRLKADEPGLRHSQLKERLFRKWQKSPENPYNQSHVSHQTSRAEEVELIRQKDEAELERLKL